MDIDKLQKINKLAMELKTHGMAVDMTDAVTQAEQMIRNGGEMAAVNQMQPSNVDSGVIRIEREDSKEDMVKMEVPNAAPEQMLEVRALQNKIKRHEETIVEMQQKMNEMIGAINKLEKKQKSEEVFPSESQASVHSQSEQPKVERQSHFKEPEPPKESPRSGKYNSGDVEIEKFFYYGNK